MNPALKTSLHCAVDNVLRQVPVVLHSGAAGSMLVAGEERWSRYLPDRFFGGGPRIHAVPTACPWRDPRPRRRALFRAGIRRIAGVSSVLVTVRQGGPRSPSRRAGPLTAEDSPPCCIEPCWN